MSWISVTVLSMLPYTDVTSLIIPHLCAGELGLYGGRSPTPGRGLAGAFVAV